MSNEQTRAVLLRAAEILEPEGAWTREAYARDAHGENVALASADAVCWCCEGAITKAELEILQDSDDTDLLLSPYEFLVKTVDRNDAYIDITEWNDAPDRTQAEVVRALRAAAESLNVEQSHA